MTIKPGAKRGKIISSAACVLLSALTLSSCSAVFNREYYVEQDYDAGYYETIPDSDIQEVRNYSGMCGALENLIFEYKTEGTIRTKNYAGTVEDDISKAINYIVRETPLGAFSVDYISPTQPRLFLTYYEFELHIYYKRTQEEIAEVQLLDIAEIYNRIDNALESFEPQITFQAATTQLTESAINTYVTERIESDLVFYPIMPEISITAYPNMVSLRKIVTLDFKYPYSKDALLILRMNNKWKSEIEPEPEPEDENGDGEIENGDYETDPEAEDSEADDDAVVDEAEVADDTDDDEIIDEPTEPQE
jgi:hypothetical protein